MDAARTVRASLVSEAVVLIGDPAARLARAAARVAAIPGLQIAVIGGLAVTCRIGQVHRATNDVDAVTDEVEAVASVASIIVGHTAATPDPEGSATRLYIDGTKVEVIETQPLGRDVEAVEPVLARLFVLGHRLALETAEPMRVQVRLPDTDVTFPVATSAALVATKLHALADRRDERKKASDGYDLLRLLGQNSARRLAEPLLRVPSLARAVAEVAQQLICDDAERVVRYMRVYGDPQWAATTADDLRLLAQDFVDKLR